MPPFAGEFTLVQPDRVISGPGTVATLSAELARLGSERAIVVTGRTLQASPLLERVTDALGRRLVAVFAGSRQHVPSATVCELAAAIRDARADTVVSFGGGSPIDTAKAAIHTLLQGDGQSCGPSSSGQSWESPSGEQSWGPASGGQSWGPPSGGPRAPVHIAIPTTLSAGEFTALAGVTDERTRVKRAVSDPRLIARVVILDPELAVLTPPWLWTASGMRALDHAVESIYSNRHHPLSDTLASRAIELLLEHLPASVEHLEVGDASTPRADDRELEHRGQCQMAAWLSVFGMINAGFGLSHVCGHQIGPRWDVPHGVTSCIMLPHAMRFMAEVAPERFGPIAKGFGVPFNPAAPRAAPIACADRTRDFVARLGLPSRLRDVNVPRHELDEIAGVVHEALEEARAVDRPVAYGEIVALLANAY